MAGISISALTRNGLFEKAKLAKNKTQEAQEYENQMLQEYENQINQLGDTLDEEIKAVSIQEIFDKTGKIEGKLHIGDFINYTAGEWKSEEISEIAETGVQANNEENLPTKEFQFGGFTVGSSRDHNAPISRFGVYNFDYVKETEKDGTKRAITGWRLFDVNDDGEMILISAGCPEAYTYKQSDFNKSFVGDYILCGVLSDNIGKEPAAGNPSPEELGIGTTYHPRNWNMYINKEFNAIKAKALSYEELENWIDKYGGIIGNSKEDSSKYLPIYGTPYESLIDINNAFWLPGNPDWIGISSFFPNSKTVSSPGGSASLGVRILVNLPSDVKLSEKSKEKKKITSKDVDYEYDVWDLKVNN